jgi:transposase
LWSRWTGDPWSELPARYGSKSAVHRRISAWPARGVLLTVWRAFLDQRHDARALLVKHEIAPIIPKRLHNTATTHQDGRNRRRDTRRWIMERTTRLAARDERTVSNCEALVHLACALIALIKV